MNQPVRVLQIVTIMNLGGLESFIMNIYRNIDRSKIQFDFLVHRLERGAFDDEIEKLGGTIFRFKALKPSKFITYRRQLKIFFKEHKEYQIVHSHLNENSAIVLNIAKKSGVPVRIAHSHAKKTAGPYTFLRELLKKDILRNSTLNLACSEDSGKWLYGSGYFEVFKNSIDTKRFKFPSNKKEVAALKEKLGFRNEDFIIGLIARFSPTKNHDFLIDIFEAYLKLNKDAHLILIGEGALEADIKSKIKRFDIGNQVVFTGNVENPEIYLSVMDLFLMTSYNEGLGIVLVEAQCNGLPTIMSDTMPVEIELTDLVHKMSLNSPASEWAKKIEEVRKKYEDSIRLGYDEIIKVKGYDIEQNSKNLVDIYLSELEKYGK